MEVFGSAALMPFAAALWIALTLLWLYGNRRWSCWPLSWKDWFLPLSPALVLSAGFIAGQAGAVLPLNVLFAAGMAGWVFLTGVWVLSVGMRNSSIMDVAYALCTVVMTLTQWELQGSDTSPRTLLLLALINLWGLRYTLYIAWRNFPHGEDARYARWRKRSGPVWWWWSYIQIFLMQFVLIWLWNVPLSFAIAQPGQIGAFEIAATLIWAIGFAFETGADWQLARFKSDPSNRGKVLTTGLWSQTRHPNYFGEAAMWVAYGMFALAHPWGWIGVIATAFTVHMMNGGSATKMTDAHLHRKKPGYAEYAAVTPTFLPRIFGGKPQREDGAS